MLGRRIALLIAFVLFAPALGLFGATSRSWQDGELLSRKTVPMGRTFLRNQYVYRVRGLNRDYLVVSETPLSLDLYVPIKFCPDHRQIWIRESDGHERKVHIIQRASTSLRQ